MRDSFKSKIHRTSYGTVCNGVLSEEHDANAALLRGASGGKTYGVTKSRLPHVDLFEHMQVLSKSIRYMKVRMLQMARVQIEKIWTMDSTLHS